MNDILEEFETLKTTLIEYYRNEFSSPSVCYTIPVKPDRGRNHKEAHQYCGWSRDM